METVDLLNLSVSDINNIFMAWTLSACRILTFIISSPFFNSKSMTKTVRTGIVVMMSISITPMVFAEIQVNAIVHETFFALVVKELFLGLVLGGVLWMPVRGIEFAGILLDTQRGSTMAQDYNVVFGSPQVTPTGIFLAQVFSGFFFASGGMLLITQVIFESATIWAPYDVLPDLNAEVAFIYGIYAGALIITAVTFALPMSGFMLLADIGIAFIAKGAPTLNALTFGMPIKSGIMLIMLFSYISIAFPSIMSSFEESLNFLTELLKR